MIMNIDLDMVLGVAGVAIGLFGIGYAVGVNRKMKDVSEAVQRLIKTG